VERHAVAFRMAARWKWLLVALCALCAARLLVNTVALFGLGGPPWFGWWDANFYTNGRPYTIIFDPPAPGGAAALGGVRGGDTLDLREQSLDSRLDLFTQPMSGKPVHLIVHRGRSTVDLDVAPAPIWQVNAGLKATRGLLQLIGGFLLIGCALLISLRRADSVDARLLAGMLLLLSVAVVGTVPSSIGTFLISIVGGICVPAALALMIALSSRFGARSRSRTVIEVLAYGAIGLAIMRTFAFFYALITLRVDPYVYGPNSIAIIQTIANIAMLLVVGMAVAATPSTERPRAGWLLLPIPIAQVASILFLRLGVNVAHTWVLQQVVGNLGYLCLVIGALAITYALLRRRVLDFEFIVGRTVVVATVSLIVVAAFTLLEWLLGTALAGIGKTGGIVANAALALALGVSLRYIHRRVDAFVDATLFRKRHEDARALLAFAKEAAFVTDPDALLDRAIADIRAHTDARSAVLYVDGAGAFHPARSYGDGRAAAVDPNDGAILALKTWHQPIDPHRSPSSLDGALAIPMLGRGRLLGVLLLGERAGGEAYAADEIETLSQFASGVGAALESLAINGEAHSVGASLAKIQTTLDAVHDVMTRIDARFRSSPS
jgi:hypothetical protein